MPSSLAEYPILHVRAALKRDQEIHMGFLKKFRVLVWSCRGIFLTLLLYSQGKFDWRYTQKLARDFGIKGDRRSLDRQMRNRCRVNCQLPK
jgi:hypothetical protein